MMSRFKVKIEGSLKPCFEDRSTQTVFNVEQADALSPASIRAEDAPSISPQVRMALEEAARTVDSREHLYKQDDVAADDTGCDDDNTTPESMWDATVESNGRGNVLDRERDLLWQKAMCENCEELVAFGMFAL